MQDEHGIPVEHIFNGDQTGLYYRKLPNRTFCNKEERKTMRGVKQMKDKDRLTIMVCTSAVGKKCPLAVVGKAARPRCFRLAVHQPMAYTHQGKAWFDKKVTDWWLRKVFLWRQPSRRWPSCLRLRQPPRHRRAPSPRQRRYRGPRAAAGPSHPERLRGKESSSSDHPAVPPGARPPAACTARPSWRLHPALLRARL